MKALLHFTVLGALFFGTWFGLSRVDFINYFHVEQFTRENEQRLGDLILDAAMAGRPEFTSDTVRTFLTGVKRRLCLANDIPDTSVSLHLLLEKDVNAFALPGGHLVVYTGLVGYCDTPEELIGVLAHEIAHMQHGHVMKRLVEQVGLSMLTTVAGGDAGGDIVRQVVRVTSSAAFDRAQETEADASAVDMMAKAGIDPRHFANLLFRLSQEPKNIPKHLEWISTHPFSQDRASQILKLGRMEAAQGSPVADSVTWAGIRRVIREHS